jgi:hypothetical protein
VGDGVILEVWRKGETIEVRAVIGESGAAPTPPPGRENGLGRGGDPEEILQALGLEVRDLSVHERMRGFHGVVVTKVSENGAAAGRLQAGDLILAVNQSHMHTAVEFFLQLTASLAVQDTVLHIIRGGRSARITLSAIPRGG